MNWIGASIGAFLGSCRGGGILGGIIGAVVGNWLEEKVRTATHTQKTVGASGGGTASQLELVTLGAISAMLSKMAKADGHISRDEVRYCENIFTQLHLVGEKREYCIRIFQQAKNDAHTIYDYASSFASAQTSADVRTMVYSVLWDLACVDGVVSPEERTILYSIPRFLGIDPRYFNWEATRHRVDDGSGAGSRSSASASPDPYEILGCSPTASDDEVRAAYRERAKRLHPDVLRAQGLSEELLNRASEHMASVNAAWSEIRRQRHL